MERGQLVLGTRICRMSRGGSWRMGILGNTKRSAGCSWGWLGLTKVVVRVEGAECFANPPLLSPTRVTCCLQLSPHAPSCYLQGEAGGTPQKIDSCVCSFELSRLRYFVFRLRFAVRVTTNNGLGVHVLSNEMGVLVYSYRGTVWGVVCVSYCICDYLDCGTIEECCCSSLERRICPSSLELHRADCDALHPGCYLCFEPRVYPMSRRLLWTDRKLTGAEASSCSEKVLLLEWNLGGSTGVRL